MVISNWEEEYAGMKWMWVFLRSDNRISLEEKSDLILEAADMYLKRENKRDVEGKSYEGCLYSSGERKSLVSFHGQLFEAELETNSGRSSLTFLIADPIDPRYN